MSGGGRGEVLPLRHLRTLLPVGRPLSDAQWALRHGTMRVLLWLHVLAVVAFALVQDVSLVHALLEGSAVAFFAVFASAPRAPRLLQSTACSLGLVISSSILVHLADGQTEMHFHYFVVIALVSLYQSTVPFIVAMIYVLLQHGVVGTLAPDSVFSHESALSNPWVWALVHAAFIGAASLVGLVNWAVNERLNLELERAAERTNRVLSSAAEGIMQVDAAGAVAYLNPSGAEMLGYEDDLPEHALLFETHDESCPICLTLWDGSENHVLKGALRKRDGSSFPAALTVTPLTSELHDGSAGAVITFHDVSFRNKLAEAEAEVERLSALEQAQRAEVIALQETLRPHRPSVPDVDLGVHYVPAEGAPVGGDFYDWVVLPNGDLHLAVVDVIGKGLPATKDALAVTHTLRTLSLEGVALEHLVERTDALLTEQSPELIATLIVARYTPETGSLRLVGASHPPALVALPDGTVTELEAPGLAVGYPGAGSTGVVEYSLPYGSALVLYTDGLVEGTRDIEDGLRALSLNASTSLHLAAAPLAEVLVTRSLEAAERRDDSLALVLRRASASDLFEARLLPGSPEPVRRVRHSLATWLQEHAPSSVDDLVLVASELCTNALKECERVGSERPVHVRAWLDSSSCVLQVTDHAGGGMVTPPVLEQPDLSEESGRGIFITQMLCDTFTVRHDGSATVVEAEYGLSADLPDQREQSALSSVTPADAAPQGV